MNCDFCKLNCDFCKLSCEFCKLNCDFCKLNCDFCKLSCELFTHEEDYRWLRLNVVHHTTRESVVWCLVTLQTQTSHDSSVKGGPMGIILCVYL